MSRTIIAAAAAAVVVLSLTACSPGAHSGAAGSSRPHPGASRTASATPTATRTPAPTSTATAAPVARLSTSPGDELLTFSGTGRSTDGSVVAVTFTVHAPVAWNTPAGTSTLAALRAAGSALALIPADDLRDTAWDSANAASLAVVDYSATMVRGSWHPGEQVEIDLGPGTSEVALASSGLSVDTGWWTMTGPGSGHFVIAFKNYDGSTPDPSNWGNSLQIYGLGAPRVTGGTPASYQFHDCRIDITPLARRSSYVAGWFTPTADYCSAGVGD